MKTGRPSKTTSRMHQRLIWEVTNKTKTKTPPPKKIWMILNIFRETEKQKCVSLYIWCKIYHNISGQKQYETPVGHGGGCVMGQRLFSVGTFTDGTTNLVFNSKIPKKNAFSLWPNTEVYKIMIWKLHLVFTRLAFASFFFFFFHLFDDLKHQSGTKSKSCKRHLTSAAVSNQTVAKLCLYGWWRTCSSL